MCPYAHKFPDLNECNYTDPKTSNYYFITTPEMHSLQLVENSLIGTKADSAIFLLNHEVVKLQREINNTFNCYLSCVISSRLQRLVRRGRRRRGGCSGWKSWLCLWRESYDGFYQSHYEALSELWFLWNTLPRALLSSHQSLWRVFELFGSLHSLFSLFFSYYLFLYIFQVDYCFQCLATGAENLRIRGK